MNRTGIAMHRQMILALILLLGGATAPPLAKAEGRCPPGFYPIGGQGMLGCAPIPVSSGNEAPPSRLRDRVVPQWAAIARSPSGRQIGWSIRQHKQASAEKGAMKACKAKSGQACEIVASYTNQCGLAVQDIRSGVFDVVVNGIDDAPGDMQENASRHCPEGGCRAAFLYCTPPYNRNGTYPHFMMGVNAAPLPWW